VLHVLWTSGQSPFTIHDSPISANGTPQSRAVIASGWFQAADPDAAATSTGLEVFWNGMKTENISDPLGTYSATRPRSGGHWSAPNAPIPPLSSSASSSGVSATGGADGKPWVAFSGTDSLVVEHLGNPEVQIAPKFKCCLYEQALATDGKSGQTWVAYASNITGNQGLFARKLMASGKPAAAAVLLPGSRTGGNAIVPLERVALTGRGKGKPGVYAAYGSGYPFFRSLDVLRLGARTPVKIATFGLTPELQGTAISADPSGRLWVAWYVNGSAPGLFVRRSDTTATKFGKTVRVPLPRGTTTVWKVYVNAQASRVDVLVLLTRHSSDSSAAYWATQVLPPR
jgi:hypothetical protein